MTAARQGAWVEEFRDQMGLDGEPAYTAQIEHGRVVEQRYWLRIDAQGEGFGGRISQAGLPARLPILVDNLSPRWTVGLLDRAAKLYRPLGQVAGTAYATIDATTGDSDLFIGHPIVADNADLTLCVTQTGDEEFALEIHNPTDAEITAHIRSPDGFTLLSVPPTEITVPAGRSLWYTVSPAGLTPRH